MLKPLNLGPVNPAQLSRQSTSPDVHIEDLSSERSTKQLANVPCRGSVTTRVFSSLVDVLHHSRRLQAESILRQYRHLIPSADERAAFNQQSNPEGATMSVTERSSLTRSSFQFALPGENTLIAILLAAFFILHVLAGAILQSATPIGMAPTQEEARASLHD